MVLHCGSKSYLGIYFSKKESCFIITKGFPGNSDGKESACNAEDLGLISAQEDPLEKGMATHSSTLAWRTPWTEEPVEL